MRTTLVCGLTAILLLAIPRADAQCGEWAPGFGTRGTEISAAAGAQIVYDDGSGARLLIGGQFMTAGGIVVNHLATWNGASWSTIGGGVGGTTSIVEGVQSFASSGTDLYVGGVFDTAGGISAHNIAKWNGTAWSALGTGISGGLRAVDAVAIYQGDVYVGGPFSTAGGAPAENIARWNGTTWSALGAGTNGQVTSLAVFNGELYVGGTFTTADGVTANRIARWNGTSFSPVGDGTSSSGLINDLIVHDNALYATGTFTALGGVPMNRIGRWDGVAWSPLGAGLNNPAYSLAVHDAQLHVAGSFTTAGGISAPFVARWTGTDWQPMGGGTDRAVLALASFGNQLYVFGDLFQIGGESVHRCARWDGANWTALPDGPGGQGMRSPVEALAHFRGDLIAAGQFERAGPTDAARIARWTGSEWAALGSGISGTVKAAFELDDVLYAGGQFLTAGGQSASLIAQWNGTTWAAVGDGLRRVPSTGQAVNALTSYRGELIAGGNFTHSADTATGAIARWNGSAWEPIGGGVENVVNALAVYNDELYAAGITTAGGAPVNNIAKWNGTSWSSVGTGMNSTVNALAVFGNDLYAAGSFTTAGGNPASHIARWDGTAWSPLGSGTNRTNIRSLGVYHGALYASGDFTSAGGVSARGIARWNGAAWSSVAGGFETNGGAYSLVEHEGALMAGGWFGVAGNQASSFVGQYTAASGRIYVNRAAPAGGNGTSWATAYQHLTDGLASAANGCGDELWVAAGTYRPDESAANPSGTGDRSASFRMTSGVAIYGAFAGTETDLSQRDSANVTILSGDLNGDDGANFANYSDNSYHVVTAGGVDSTALLDLVTVRGGNADGAAAASLGGGLYALDGSPTLRNCIFLENRAASGGAMYFAGFSGPALDSLQVSRNAATSDSAGVHVLGNNGGPYADVLLLRCIFAGNSAPPTATGAGGGLALASCNARVLYCLFQDNAAARGAGAILSAGGSMSVLGSTFVRNVASAPSTFCSGGGLRITNLSNATVQNCVFEGNRATNGVDGAGGGLIVSNDSSSTALGNLIFVGNVAERGGALHTQNTGTQLRNITAASNVATQLGGGFYLGATGGNASPANCILWGNSDSSGLGATSQIAAIGSPTTAHYCLAQGGYAGSGNVDADPLFKRNPNPGADGQWDGVNDDYGDVRVRADSPAIDAGDNATVPTDRLDINNNGNTTEPIGYDVGNRERFREIVTAPNSGAGTAPLTDIGAWESLAGPILVDNTPSGAWLQSTDSLQGALTFARSYADEANEIWVAAGTYKPDYHPSVIAPGDRGASFALVDGVGVYGGFAGNETERDQRDIQSNTTILSGDLAGDDNPAQFPNGASQQDNSRHVVTGSGAAATASLDGFFIEGGNANGVGWPDGGGGGLYVDAGSPTLRRCWLRMNSSSGAGAVEGGGGGTYLRGGAAPTFVDCVWERNIAAGVNAGGGALYVRSSSPRCYNARFFGNSAYAGGGVNAVSAGAGTVFVNCLWSGNLGTMQGGALDLGSSSPDLINCTLAGNVAGVVGGGGVFTSSGSPKLRNCILWGNTDTSAGTDVEQAQLYVFAGGATLTRCDVQGLASYAGDGNIGVDPRFADAAGSDSSVGTPDDDLRLRSGSPAADAGDNSRVPADTADLDGDANTAEPTPLDLAGAARFSNGPCSPNTGVGAPPIVDMGAYETQGSTPAASGSIAFVRAGATGLNDGTSWANAFAELRDALCAAGDNPSITEIWTAAGTYTPTDDGDRTRAFALVDNVALYGGFAGTETQREQRDPAANATILSGDLNGDDGPAPFDPAQAPPPAWAENSYHVVVADGAVGAVLDGVVIRHGNANGPGVDVYDPLRSGGGISARSDGSATIRNCRIVENNADGVGGGLNLAKPAPSQFSDWVMEDCAVERNRAVTAGAAIGNIDYWHLQATGCTFADNYSYVLAGAISGNSKAWADFRACTFARNTGRAGGAIHWNSQDELTVSDCRFEDNRTSAADGHGGAVYFTRSIATLVNCEFFRNSAGEDGGALAVSGYTPQFLTTLTLANCTFVGNSSASGGAISCVGTDNGGAVAIANCTLVDNRATIAGGGIWLAAGTFPGSSPTIANCVLWNNVDAGGIDASAQIHVAAGSPAVSYCDILGGYAGGTNIIDFDPRFVRSPSPGGDGNWDGVDDDYGDLRLGFHSPAADSGNLSALPVDTIDLDGDANTSERIPFDLAGAPRAVNDPCATNSGAGAPPIDVGAYERQPAVPQPTLYVRENADGANDGSSWRDAFHRLDEALCVASGSGGAVREIWVAAGVYAPRPQWTTPPREASFALVDGVAVYGGFVGDETSADERRPQDNETILSGDRAAPTDDPGEFPAGTSYDDNLYHVVVATNVAETTTLDGFLIRGGNADGPGGAALGDLGGGLLLNTASPLVRACRFENNQAATGGGGVGTAFLSRARFENCEFRSNFAFDAGAAWLRMALGGRPVMRDCRFEGNSAAHFGGAVTIQSSFAQTAQLVGCTFVANRADWGGGVMQSGAARGELVNCVFAGNVATANGGGAAFNGGSAALANCAFVGNRLEDNGDGSIEVGAGMYNNVAQTVISNCTFAANDATISGAQGGGLYTATSNPTINNSIFWANAISSGTGSAAQIRVASGTPAVAYCVVQGGFAGGANILDADPLFARNPGNGGDRWGDDPETVGVDEGANDDYGDLRLQRAAEGMPSTGSPAIDSGDNGRIPTDVGDVDCDGNTLESLPFDLSGAPRRYDDLRTDAGAGSPPIIDRGAYEGGPLTGAKLYVNASAPPNGDGQSWATAYQHVAQALEYAAAGGCGALEVWVARGTYMPDGGRVPFGGSRIGGSGDRSATFRLHTAVVLYGGFAGGETSTGQRDIVANATILSGDLAGNGPTQIDDDSFHVVTGTDTTALAILDGFTIRGGNADDGLPGGGFVSLAGGPLLRNCAIEQGDGACAGALAVSGGRIAAESLRIRNSASDEGAAAAISQGAVDLPGDFILENGRLDVFGASFAGAGDLRIESAALLRVKAASACGAETVRSASADLPPTEVYVPSEIQPPTPARWQILNAQLHDIVLAGQTHRWYIAPADGPPATLDWTDSLIAADLSTIAGRADARFHGGGTLRLTGRVYEGPTVASRLVLDGELLVATVGEFRVQETADNSNLLTFVERPAIVPTGGLLVSNTEGLVLTGGQVLSMAPTAALQDGGNVAEFFDGVIIELSASAALALEPIRPPSSETALASDVRGTGSIEIERGATLALVGDATLNLSGLPDEFCQPEDAPAASQVQVDGTLIVRERAQVRSTRIGVNGVQLDDVAEIAHNDIRLLEASPGFGGQFFASDQAQVVCNVIRSQGDRYLDLDPDPSDGRQPFIANNRIYVQITQGVGADQGEMLELRSPDYDNAVAGGHSGAYLLGGSAGYSDTWALEELEILSDAKCNLTNRQGFDFTPTISTPEALYVKRLRLHDDAVLNTGLQRVYYQSLVDASGAALVRDPDHPAAPMANGSRIVDAPVLGFSLKVIRMESQAEFDVRVQSRTLDPADPNPPAPAQPTHYGSVARITTNPEGPEQIPPGAGGVMELRTRALPSAGQSPPPVFASSVTAQGAFARAAEEEIIVAFDYLFVADPANPSGAGAELTVYLSDQPAPDPAPGACNTTICNGDYCEVARIRPPTGDRAGAVGSGRLASFFGRFPRGALNFTRGTYVALRLCGQNTRVWIDNWDPQINCSTSQCGSFDNDLDLDNVDFLYVVAEYGQSLDFHDNATRKWCLDSSLSSDNYIDVGDLLSWDAVLNGGFAFALCNGDQPGPDGGGLAGGGGTPVSLPEERFVVAGKPGGPPDGDGLLQEDILAFASESGGALSCAEPPARPASAPGFYGIRGNGRLLTDSLGRVHQIHATQGVIRLDNADVVVPGRSVPFGANQVHVGFQFQFGRITSIPITDAVFHPTDPDVIYVVPVYVTPPSGPSYRAAAKLRLDVGNPSSPFTVEHLYGADPSSDECVNCEPPEVSECDVQRLREIEIDAAGQTLFVLSAKADNDNDWLLIYDEDGPQAGGPRVLLTSLDEALTSPSALRYRPAGGGQPESLFVTSATNARNVSDTRVYRLDISRGAQVGVSLAATTVVNNMRFAVDLAVRPNSPDVWALGMTAPPLCDCMTGDPGDPCCFTYCDVSEGGCQNWDLFTTPTIARIRPGQTSVSAADFACGNLALPVSLLWHPAVGLPADMNCDGLVDNGDIDAFVLALLDRGAYESAFPTCRYENGDVNADGFVDNGDIDAFVQCLLGGGCE